jgi:hypothetical protein
LGYPGWFYVLKLKFKNVQPLNNTQMKNLIKTGIVVIGIATMSSCGLFDSNDQPIVNDPADETATVPVDTIQKIDSADDAGDEMVKEEVKAE